MAGTGEKDYSIDELAEMLTDQILKEQFLSKQNIQPIIKAFIKAFVNLKNIPKNYNAYESKTKRAARIRAAEKATAEAKFWHNTVLSLDPENMQKYYKLQDAFLESKGLKHI